MHAFGPGKSGPAFFFCSLYNTPRAVMMENESRNISTTPPPTEHVTTHVAGGASERDTTTARTLMQSFLRRGKYPKREVTVRPGHMLYAINRLVRDNVTFWHFDATRREIFKFLTASRPEDRCVYEGLVVNAPCVPFGDIDHHIPCEESGHADTACAQRPQVTTAQASCTTMVDRL